MAKKTQEKVTKASEARLGTDKAGKELLLAIFATESVLNESRQGIQLEMLKYCQKRKVSDVDGLASVLAPLETFIRSDDGKTWLDLKGITYNLTDNGKAVKLPKTYSNVKSRIKKALIAGYDLQKIKTAHDLRTIEKDLAAKANEAKTKEAEQQAIKDAEAQASFMAANPRLGKIMAIAEGLTRTLESGSILESDLSDDMVAAFIDATTSLRQGAAQRRKEANAAAKAAEEAEKPVMTRELGDDVDMPNVGAALKEVAPAMQGINDEIAELMAQG